MIFDLIVWLLFSRDVSALSSCDFAERETAEVRLKTWGWITWRLCDRCVSVTKDAEQRRRARRVVSSVIPQSYPAISTLAGIPLPEWSGYDGHQTLLGERPNIGWILIYTKPDHKSPLIKVADYYHERVRTEHRWKEWYSSRDAEEATKELMSDLIKVRVPTPLILLILKHMEYRQSLLPYYPNKARPLWVRSTNQ